MVKTLVLVRHGVSERGSEDMSRELTRCLLYTSPSPRDPKTSRMPSSA